MPQNKASAWLYVMRNSRNLSQRKLAGRVGLTYTAISDAESKAYASAETWAKLAVFFRMSTDAILWLAGVIQLSLPPKDEIIARINRDLDEMDPETRRKAETLIQQITDDP
jgi:transcriptional regulator with XRE-family HTH domain